MKPGRGWLLMSGKQPWTDWILPVICAGVGLVLIVQGVAGVVQGDRSELDVVQQAPAPHQTDGSGGGS